MYLKMEKSNSNWYAMSDPAILAVLGNFVQQTRLQQNKTQQQAASAAGINRSTLVQVENGGGGTLATFIQILRVLQQLHLLQQFETKQPISPMQLAIAEQKKRRRATTAKKSTERTPKSTW
jgi:transcriptional regulator with XRE-family HTH domain